jgi:hypothetical protein
MKKEFITEENELLNKIERETNIVHKSGQHEV